MTHEILNTLLSSLMAGDILIFERTCALTKEGRAREEVEVISNNRSGTVDTSAGVIRAAGFRFVLRRAHDITEITEIIRRERAEALRDACHKLWSN